MGRRPKTSTAAGAVSVIDHTGREALDREHDALKKFNGLHCSECFELQFEASDGAGITCKNGHGGAEGIGPQDVPKTNGGKLAAVVEKAGEEERVMRARMTFASANAAKKKPMRAEIVRIVDTMIVKDVEAAYHRIVAWLAIGEQRSDRGTLMKRLDEAQTHARDAFLLWTTVKNAREAWEKTNDVYFANMKVEAHRELQREKDAKQRNKQITDGDVATMCAVLFGDQWVKDEIERAKFIDFEATLKDLAERCRERAYDLRSMLSALR